MADEKRVYVENPTSPGAGVYFTGENAEKEAAAYRANAGIVEPPAVKEVAKAENKAVKAPETK